MRLLLVEDERKLSQVLAKGLKKLSYTVDQAFDGEEALELFSVYGYDLVVLDLNLPKIDGWEVLRQIRQQDRQVKVLILSAKNQVEDKIAGLDLGANDYLEKPFDFLELAARIRNLLRWEFVQRESQWEDGRLKIDFSAKTVLVDGEEIALTHKEYGILEYLVQNRTRFVSAEELLEHVWDREADLFSNTLKYHIHSLKKKLGLPEVIQNERGKGYRYAEHTEK
jgi:transcriptional activator protein